MSKKLVLKFESYEKNFTSFIQSNPNRQYFGSRARMKNKDWIVAYASAIGNLHIKENLPCQDACAIKNLGAGWGVAVVADGAGSCEYADKGAAHAVNLAIQHFANLVYRNKWIEKNSLPTEEEWARLSLENFKLIKDDLFIFSEQKEIVFESLSCTLIVLVYSTIGVLLAHVGDGRAGYMDAGEEWKPLLTPFKGEEANQTIFITSDFEKSIGSKVVTGQIAAFCLLSDGCEKSAFECNLYDRERNLYYDPNRPFPKFFNPNILALKQLYQQNKSQDEINTLWQGFLEGGNTHLKNEPDDKTLILGVKL